MISVHSQPTGRVERLGNLARIDVVDELSIEQGRAHPGLTHGQVVSKVWTDPLAFHMLNTCSDCQFIYDYKNR